MPTLRHCPYHHKMVALGAEMMERLNMAAPLHYTSTEEEHRTTREAGATDIAERARDKVRRVLAEHYPGHVEAATDARVRRAFDIRLDRDAMAPGNGRW